MSIWRGVCALLAFAGAWSTGSASRASFHLWAIEEIFSSADGTVQFVELTTAASGETALNGHTLEATSDGVLKTFTLNHNVAFPTANKRLLFATAGFGSLPGGVTPDYSPLPPNFFNPNAASISIVFAHGVDVAAFSGATLPKDGVTSLKDANTLPNGPDVFMTGVNTPTNFAGASGSVNLGGGGPVVGDFNGNGMVDGADLTVWRTNFGASGAPPPTQGNTDADGDVDGRDFLVWQRRLGATSGAVAAGAVPEATSAALAGMGCAAVAAVARPRRRCRRLVQGASGLDAKSAASRRS